MKKIFQAKYYIFSSYSRSGHNCLVKYILVSKSNPQLSGYFFEILKVESSSDMIWTMVKCTERQISLKTFWLTQAFWWPWDESLNLWDCLTKDTSLRRAWWSFLFDGTFDNGFNAIFEKPTKILKLNPKFSCPILYVI